MNNGIVSFSSVTKNRFGDSENYSKFESDGKLHFYGDARPKKLHINDATLTYASHQIPLAVTTLAAAAGMTVSSMDTAPDNSRRIEVQGVDGGVHVKGRLKAAYSQEDTAGSADFVKIKLTTTNATWNQSSDWRLFLDITTGNITGKFTIFMPKFSLMEYSLMEVWVTNDGATYLTKTSCGFERSLSGSIAVSQDLGGNISAGDDVVCLISDTSGYYEGNEAIVSDSENSEFVRIKSIVTNTSITVDTMANGYTTANGAKLDIIDFIKTCETVTIQRGIASFKKMAVGENSGIVCQRGLPQERDPDADVEVVIQYVGSVGNPSGHIAKMRTQVHLVGLGEAVPETNQYGTLVYADLTPLYYSLAYFHTLYTIPAADVAGKSMIAIEVARMGEDAGDTYTGDLKAIAIFITTLDNKLGYEI